MGRKNKHIPNYNPHPALPKSPVITSLLDQMKEGTEYSSIIGLKKC